MSTPRHFLDLAPVGGKALRAILDEAGRRKQARNGLGRAAPDRDGPLQGKLLAMVFERPSTRTRVSFDVAMRQLGGETLLLNGGDMQLGRGETIADTARVLSRYVDAIMLRSSSAEKLDELAAHASVPVINGLTNKSHPCQLMADIMTFEEHLGPIAGRTVAWSGDGSNNVAASWIEAAGCFGFNLTIATPAALAPDMTRIADARKAGAGITITQDPAAAVTGADCVVTDTWVSMGDEEVAARRQLLTPYRVDENLMAVAAPRAIFLHCLPAHRGDEVTDGVLDGAQSAAWDAAENRLHAQKGVLAWCLS